MKKINTDNIPSRIFLRKFFRAACAFALTLSLLPLTSPCLTAHAADVTDQPESFNQTTSDDKDKSDSSKKKKTKERKEKYSYKKLLKYTGQASSSRKITGINGYKPGKAAKKKLNAAIKSVRRGGRDVSFVVMDVKTMKGVSYNAGRRYYSASAIKGPYVVSAVRKRPYLLKSRRSTINQILKYSDNNAYIGFAKKYGFGSFNSWVKKSGAVYKRTKGNRCYGYFTAKNMAKIWVSNYEYFRTDKTGRKMGKMFQHPAVSAIHSSLGGKYTTRSKAGWIAAGGRFNVTNDAGIVYSKKGSYIIVIMSSVPSDMAKLRPLVRALDYAHNDMVR